MTAAANGYVGVMHTLTHAKNVDVNVTNTVSDWMYYAMNKLNNDKTC